MAKSQNPSAKQQPHPWSSDALLAKAQKSAESLQELTQDDWRFGLWSSFVLELLLRAALARVSPALLAASDKGDWQQLYFALGHPPTAKKFVARSIGTHEVMTRLKGIYKEFTPELESACTKVLESRNEELHTGGTPFISAGTSSWLPGFYAACDTLLSLLGGKLEYLFGDDAAAARALVKASQDESAKAIKKTVAAHERSWEAVDSEEQAVLRERAAVWATRQAGHRVPCPACGSTALVFGSPAGAPRRTISEDHITEKQDFLPAKFECVACGLKISGLSHLAAAGVGDGFTSTSVYEAAELYAQEPEFEEDFNEY